MVKTLLFEIIVIALHFSGGNEGTFYVREGEVEYEAHFEKTASITDYGIEEVFYDVVMEADDHRIEFDCQAGEPGMYAIHFKGPSDYLNDADGYWTPIDVFPFTWGVDRTLFDEEIQSVVLEDDRALIYETQLDMFLITCPDDDIDLIMPFDQLFIPQ